MSDVLLEQLIREVTSLRKRVEGLETAGRGACKFLHYNLGTDSNVTGNGTEVTVEFDQVVFDLGSNIASHTFTAPTTDKYWLHATVLLNGLTAAMTRGLIRIVTSNRTYQAGWGNVGAMRGTSDDLSMQVTALADMDAADTAYVTVIVFNGAGDTADIYGGAGPYTYFCGCRIP